MYGYIVTIDSEPPYFGVHRTKRPQQNDVRASLLYSTVDFKLGTTNATLKSCIAELTNSD
jgi:hypothetical protein